jgi:hypothetical protein
MTIPDIVSMAQVFIAPDPARENVWTARLVLRNGTTAEISYTKIKRSSERDFGPHGEALIRVRDGLAIISHEDFHKIVRQFVALNDAMGLPARVIQVQDLSPLFQQATVVESDRLDATTAQVAQARLSQFASERKERDTQRRVERQELRQGVEQQEATALWKVRVFHVLTGILGTPITMAIGLVRLAIRCAQIGALACGYPVVKVMELASKHPVQIQGHFKSERIITSLQAAVRDVQIALLQMIPFVGAQLASIYRASGSWSDFLDTPAIGGLLDEMGVSVSKIVYGGGARSDKALRRMVPDETSYIDGYIQPYLNQKQPTIEMTESYIDQHLQTETPSSPLARPLPVRIPFVGSHGQRRYHDGTMYFASGSRTGKTVVLYHGNTMPRDDCTDMAIKYLDQGYNVLMASYAGDFVVQGDGAKHIYRGTKCSERAMIEDAQADVDFLHHIGVREVSVEGWSLGGAQAMNFARAVAERHPNDMAVDSVALASTFTNVPEVCQNVLRNARGAFLGRLAGDFARRSIMSETANPKRYGCDGLDNREKLKYVVRAKPFAHTTFAFFGGESDPMMASVTQRPELHFATDLYETGLEASKDMQEAQQRFVWKIFPGGHEATFNTFSQMLQSQLLFRVIA